MMPPQGSSFVPLMEIFRSLMLNVNEHDMIYSLIISLKHLSGWRLRAVRNLSERKGGWGNAVVGFVLGKERRHRCFPLKNLEHS